MHLRRPAHARTSIARRSLSILISLLTALTVAGIGAVPALASNPGVTFTVNSTADGSDANTADALCDDGTGQSQG